MIAHAAQQRLRRVALGAPPRLSLPRGPAAHPGLLRLVVAVRLEFGVLGVCEGEAGEAVGRRDGPRGVRRRRAVVADPGAGAGLAHGAHGGGVEAAAVGGQSQRGGGGGGGAGEGGGGAEPCFPLSTRERESARRGRGRGGGER